MSTPLRFIDRLKLEQLEGNGRTRYRLLEDCTLFGQFVTGNLEITAPQGYETDLASVPRAFWILIPPSGRYAPACVIHDYLLDTGCSRFFADAVLRESMYSLGVSMWKRLLIYYGVRAYATVLRLRGIR